MCYFFLAERNVLYQWKPAQLRASVTVPTQETSPQTSATLGNRERNVRNSPGQTRFRIIRGNDASCLHERPNYHGPWKFRYAYETVVFLIFSWSLTLQNNLKFLTGLEIFWLILINFFCNWFNSVAIVKILIYIIQFLVFQD